MATGRQKDARHINDLIKAVQRDSFQGIDKPETLRHILAGY
ncbi:type II toxin-antitoxin system YoeB family toxin [Xanthomonas hawaiiensis]